MFQFSAAKNIVRPTFISDEGGGKGTHWHSAFMMGDEKVLVTTEPSGDVWSLFNAKNE